MSVSLPIPEPRAEDDEDVHWALSTASALWARGEPQEALKWLRRAAETASDANRDARSLELFKAAADFANGIQGAPKTSAPPAPPQQPPPAVPPAGWPTLGVVQMTVGNPQSQPQPRPQSSAPPPPHRSQPPPIPQPNNGGPPPLHRAPPQHAHTPAAPAVAQGRGPIHPPPQRLGSTPNLSSPPLRGQTRGETQTWQPRPGLPPAGPFQTAAGGGLAMPLSDVMAPTVPHPSPTSGVSQIPWPPPGDPSTARIPITDVDAAIKSMEAQRGANVSMKTLASNTSFEDLADESVRKSAKSAKPTPRDPRLSSDRSTNPGVGPDNGNGTSLSPPNAVITSAVTPPRQNGTVVDPAQAGLTPKSKRRATQTGRRGTKTDPTEQVTRIAAVQPQLLRHAREDDAKTSHGVPPPGVPSGEVTILEANGQEGARTARFDDEGTMEQHATLVGVPYDLDEQTNVLSGSEVNLVLRPNHQDEEQADDVDQEKVSALEADEAPTSETPTEEPHIEPPQEPRRDRPVTERPVTERPGADAGIRSLSAYRVALYRTPGGALEVKMLAPGEPTPAGRVGAILVPVDAVSSSALYDLLAAKSR